MHCHREETIEREEEMLLSGLSGLLLNPSFAISQPSTDADFLLAHHTILLKEHGLGMSAWEASYLWAGFNTFM